MPAGWRNLGARIEIALLDDGEEALELGHEGREVLHRC